uniref:Glycerol-3-phosphate acyltransferase 2, mitochondrial n=1 Tax=Otus sunia TaxID=257818 RepID=A0A8C8B263_9STRI
PTTKGEGRCDLTPPIPWGMKTWVCDSGQKLEIFIPFLGKSRPFSGRCCQTCTPKSWPLSPGTSLSVSLPRYRGWLVRRVCGFLAVWGWKVPADTPGDLPVLQHRPPAPGDPVRLCHWALLKLLNCLFLNVQLHRGQLAMVLRAPHAPLVFLSTHKSPLDGLLLSFLLFSQGLGVPRVAVGGQACSSPLRALLRRLGGIFLPSRTGQTPSDQDGGLPGAVLRPARPLGLGTCLWAAWGALRRNRGCARVDFAQPFSLQVRPRVHPPSACLSSQGWGGGEAPPQHLLGDTPWDATTGAFCGPRARGGGSPPPRLPTAAPSLADGVSCSAVTAVAITSVLLLHKHREDFAWLLEEILLGQHDVGFSGRLRALVQHSLVLLAPHLAFYRLAPIGDVLVVPEASAEALSELGHHGAALLPVFASEAVGACAIRALLAEMLPFLGAGAGLSGIVLSQDELHRKTLELLQLLPLNLLGLQPCQPLNYRSQDIVDKLLLCGVLEVEEGPAPGRDGRQRQRRRQRRPQALLQGTGGSPGAPRLPPGRGFHPSLSPPLQLSEPQGSPGLLLFLCRLLSPVLRIYARAAAFLDRPSWPQPGRTPPGGTTAAPPAPAPPRLALGETEAQPKLPCSPGSPPREGLSPPWNWGGGISPPFLSPHPRGSLRGGAAAVPGRAGPCG